MILFRSFFNRDAYCMLRAGKYSKYPSIKKKQKYEYLYKCFYKNNESFNSIYKNLSHFQDLIRKIFTAMMFIFRPFLSKQN